MRLPARRLLALLAMTLSCSLPLEEKAACDEGSDCLDGRACVDGQCTDGACGLTCDAVCSARDACGSSLPCTANCNPELTSVFGLDPVQCGIQYDLLDDGSCEALSCFDACAATCDQGVACALLDDAATCTIQCQLEGPCPASTPGCNELDAAALSCWARGKPRGC